MPNPFDNAEGRFRVVVNDEGQHALWRPAARVPAGWTVAYGAADRSLCLGYVNEHWTDMRPSSLVALMEQREPETADAAGDGRAQQSAPGDARAHEVFEQQARRTPDAPALICGDRVVTYAELDESADHLADRLRGAGVRPESRVALFLDRGIDLVVSVLAVLKAGGAYVPLSVRDPADRIAFMVEDADVEVLLTDTHRAQSLPTVASPVLLVEQDGGAEPCAARASGGSRPAPQNAAYIIYTSGSTGRPKGVVVTQSGLANYLSWSVGAYRVTMGAGAPMVSPLRFDLSVTTLFCPLLAGRPVTLVPEGEELETLVAILSADLEFGLVKLTPAHLDALDRAMPPAEIKADGYLVAGGESLHGSTAAAWRKRAPGLRLVNEYGPTETVVGCCVYEVGEDADLSGLVPIGQPIANTRVYVLDDDLEPVAGDTIGELYVGGAGVARGYWNRPDLTAERFLPDPIGPPGSRLYRTGDLARIRPDGQIECLGRVDSQVKVRGYRVELEEIESCITRLPEVREALLLLRQETPRRRRLVAYVTGTDASRPPQDANLRAALQRELPDYMIPDVFVIMEALPLAANGKVDRRALPRPVSR